ncbi:MAG TPA: MaoC family dehydratase [Candidatus Binatia bacterium]|nr:MaoC family dehydratase [Candidatus Binatia bacterium]
MGKRHLEDFEVGETFELGSCHVTREEILEFARRYDPQPFHVDEEAARRSIYGGLIASGWHTTAMLMRLLVDGMDGAASMGSPGADEIRWLKPVRPGDTLTARGLILDVVPSRSKPDRGHIRAAYEVFNQRGEKVMTMISRGIYARRPGVAKEEKK